MHAGKYPAAFGRVESARQKTLEEAARLRIAEREGAVYRAGQWIALSRAVGGRMC